MNKCRLCSNELFITPILRLADMPRGAQFFSEGEQNEEYGIELLVYQCSGCGLIQLNIEPVSYYKEVITATSFSDITKQFRFNLMSDIVAKYSLKGKNIIEIGCGKGDMLDILNSVGMAAYGLEASMSSAEFGRSAGRNISCGYIGETIGFDGLLFDAFVCFNYLEHLPDINKAMRQIYNNTTKNAIGVITVPNLEELLRSRCLYEFVADHLSYFTQKTLQFALEMNGFTVLDCYTINDDNDIIAVIKKRMLIDLTDAYNDVNQLIISLKEIDDEYISQKKTIAVWGAGHRTLSLLSLSRLNSIKFVIDSAKFKQGKKTPILQIPICSSDVLLTNPVDLVIVMVPGIYPLEVLNTIEKMHINSNIAIIKDNTIKFLSER
jgi:2-polyprenyl-3-methyl-5-hydroxy-6-metoxy-1,4-benzoquinol methylase